MMSLLKRSEDTSHIIYGPQERANLDFDTYDVYNHEAFGQLYEFF